MRLVEPGQPVPQVGNRLNLSVIFLVLLCLSSCNLDKIFLQEGDWSTLYFLPGLHDVGLSYRLHSNRSYYIPGDAVVYGTLNTGQDLHDGTNIRIWGHGTLSGDKLHWPSDKV